MLLHVGLVVVTHAAHVTGHCRRICSPKVMTPSPPAESGRIFVELHQSLIDGFSEHAIGSSMSLQKFPDPVWVCGPSSLKSNSFASLAVRAFPFRSAFATGTPSANIPMNSNIDRPKQYVRGRVPGILSVRLLTKGGCLFGATCKLPNCVTCCCTSTQKSSDQSSCFWRLRNAKTGIAR